MKTHFIILLLLVSFLFSEAQDYEMVRRDTINLIDVNSKKQGPWVIMGRHKPGSCFQPEQKMEEGMYKDNKRIGVWKQYYCNSNLKNKITYVDGKPSGATALYYETGLMKEEGTWINNRWVGNYKLYDEKGNITEMVFDDKGKEVSRKTIPAKNSVTSPKK